MSPRPDGGLELKLPSQFGMERPAREAAAELARATGFSDERVEDIKTALGEAVLNAIEHGNALDRARIVRVVLFPAAGGLELQVWDQSTAPFVPSRAQREAPDVADKLRAGRVRGLGLFLIDALADEVEYVADSLGNKVCLRVYLAGRAPGGHRPRRPSN